MMKVPKYHLDYPPGVFGKRVFVGGCYRYIVLLEEIYKAVLDCGFTPIFAREFGIPAGTTRHSAKRLVQHCKYAIFETSMDGGYFFEMEDAENYSCVTLCLWEASPGGTPRISEMARTTNLFKKNNKPYGDISELRSHVRSFL
jgi:hypothetical protein